MTLRRDALTGAGVFVNAHRQQRPNLPATDCPFCPGGLEAPEPYEVRWFENRWPSMPDGRCEVVLYSPVHDATFWSLGVDGAARVVQLWAERTEALGAREEIAYVLPFENRGAEVGATIPHPHGQVFAFDDVPDSPARELASDEDAGAACALCDEDPGDRIVNDAGRWRAWVPHAATSPYELRVAPVDHVPDLPADVAIDDGKSAAAALVDALARLDRLFDAPMPYMLWVHHRPTGGGPWPAAHVHVHVMPLYRAPGVTRFVASGELGSGIFFNPVDPVDAAEALREA